MHALHKSGAAGLKALGEGGGKGGGGEFIVPSADELDGLYATWDLGGGRVPIKLAVEQMVAAFHALERDEREQVAQLHQLKGACDRPDRPALPSDRAPVPRPSPLSELDA